MICRDRTLLRKDQFPILSYEKNSFSFLNVWHKLTMQIHRHTWKWIWIWHCSVGQSVLVQTFSVEMFEQENHWIHLRSSDLSHPRNRKAASSTNFEEKNDSREKYRPLDKNFGIIVKVGAPRAVELKAWAPDRNPGSPLEQPPLQSNYSRKWTPRFLTWYFRKTRPFLLCRAAVRC